MIEVILKGGLGNQLFQFAAGYSLSKKFNTQIILNEVFLKTNLPVPGFTKRAFELDLFGIERSNLKTNNSVTSYIFSSLNLLRKKNTLIENNVVFNYLGKVLPLNLKSDPYIYYDEFDFLQDGAILEGSFNNVKYFDKYQNELKGVLNVDLLYDPTYESVEKQILNSNSVAIHIRKGDYLNKKNKNIYIELNDYYQSAIKHVKTQIQDPKFYVFASDIHSSAEVAQFLKLSESEFVHMDKSFTGTRYKSFFRLMSLCDIAVISNSTFSFWAAYLGRSKLTVCPKKWTLVYSDFEVPKNWIGVYN